MLDTKKMIAEVTEEIKLLTKIRLHLGKVKGYGKEPATYITLSERTPAKKRKPTPKKPLGGLGVKKMTATV